MLYFLFSSLYAARPFGILSKYVQQPVLFPKKELIIGKLAENKNTATGYRIDKTGIALTHTIKTRGLPIRFSLSFLVGK